MRLTKQSTYAVRALIYCAVNTGDLARVSEIAAAYTMSETFLFKLIKPLVTNGILETVRGRNGGIRLAKDAKDISLYDVIILTEDNFLLAECMLPDGSDCPIQDICQFNQALCEALEGFFDVLRKYTIQDLASNRAGLRERFGLSK